MKWIAAVALVVAAVSPAAAQVADKPVAELQGVDIKEHLNEKLPLQLPFVDEYGRAVQLGEYFTGQKPVLLTLNYYNCPMLCTLQLNGLVDALKNINLVPGQDFEMVTVSFNPRETPNLAQLKKANYVKAFRPEAARGWHFLVGKQPEIDALTKATGFGYTYDEKTGQYAHAAVTMVVTPDGHLSRYLYGVFFEPKDPQTLRLSLLEAAKGKIGTPLDQILLFCYHYDPQAGSYSLAAFRMMQIVAGLSALLLLGVLGSFWLREYRKSRVVVQDVQT